MDDTGPPTQIERFTRWATTPPQSYAVYLGALILVFVLSFYAGTMKPKQAPGPAPAAGPSVPHS